MKPIGIVQILIVSLLLNSCILQETEKPIVYYYTGADGEKHSLERKSAYFDTQGFVVRNIEFCNKTHQWAYFWFFDWVDYNADGSIREAGCFDSTLKRRIKDGDFPLSDTWWTYYGDKDGGEYNVRRISTHTGAIKIFFTVPESLPMPIIAVWSNYFLYGMNLEWLTDIANLKFLPTLSWSTLFLLTDWTSVWSYKTKIQADPDTAYEKEPGLIVDKYWCFFVFMGSAEQIKDCDPKTIHLLTGSQLDKSAQKKILPDETTWRQVIYKDKKHSYDEYGHLLVE